MNKKGAVPCGLLSAFLLLGGCVSLDPFLFNGEALDAYLLDAYTGSTECSDALDSLAVWGYPSSASQYHPVTLPCGGSTLHALLLSPTPQLESSDTLLLYFHGNGPHIDYYWPRTRLLYATGLPVLVIDYSGFGLSDGEATEKRLYANAQTALDHVRTQLGNPFVVVVGYSLGSMVATDLVYRNPGNSRITGLFLETPFSSIQTIVSDGSYLDFPASYVTTFSGDNREKIASITTPFLWMHGERDQTLGHETNGIPLWQNYGGTDGYAILVAQGGHNNLPGVLGYQTYIACVGAFARHSFNENPLLQRGVIVTTP